MSPDKENALKIETSTRASATFSTPERHAFATRPDDWQTGLLLGCLGLLAFSGTLPATRLAVPIFGPTILTCSRIEGFWYAGVVSMFLGSVA